MPTVLVALAEHWRSVAAAVLLVSALAGSAFALWPRPPAPLTLIPPTPRPTSSPAPQIVVHVVGAVAAPGVYQLPSGSRASDAISRAGGLAEDADPSSLNLAARLVDGQQVVVRTRPVPAPERQSGEAVEPRPGGKLNLNLASAADLDTLPGVGPVLAQRIVERRHRVGPFQSVEQLKDERIVPSATYERIKDLVIVN